MLMIMTIKSILIFYLNFWFLVIRNPPTEALSSMANAKDKWNTHTFAPTVSITSVLITAREITASFCESLRRDHITAYLESIGKNR